MGCSCSSLVSKCDDILETGSRFEEELGFENFFRRNEATDGAPDDDVSSLRSVRRSDRRRSRETI